MSQLVRSIARVCFAVLLSLPAWGQGGGVFSIRFDAERFPDGFEGDLFVAFCDVSRGEPRQEMHRWFGAPPVMRFRIEGAKAGGELRLAHGDAVATFPRDWMEVEPGEWKVQAVARRSFTGRQAGLDAGDVHSFPEAIAYDPASKEEVALVLDQVVPERRFQETERVRLFELESEALSEFHDRSYILRAGVLLPVGYEPGKTYPVLYSVTGFGGTHQGIHGWQQRVTAESPLSGAIVVIPDATNRYGHSVFCDSPSIGPWGKALVEELIPALEAKFGGAGPERRYVTGVSSGGWSSLWLQVTYPSAFAGCFSHVPDPIDFHDFQRVDLYTPLEDGSPRNMYVDEEGNERTVARIEMDPPPTYRSFVEHEHVLNPGGQVRSFEATFSPRGADGMPVRVFDVATGKIDHAVAAAWKPYDISHTLLTRWDDLRGELAGKIHIYAGELDTFYLEGAVQRFQEKAREAGILDEMVVEVVPGMGHALHTDGFQEMLDVMFGSKEPVTR